MRLAIEGTQRPLPPQHRLREGLRREPADPCRTSASTRHFGALEQFPAAIVALLRDLYQRGTAVGIEMMELLFHGRALREGEAVYFALDRCRARAARRRVRRQAAPP